MRYCMRLMKKCIRSKSKSNSHTSNLVRRIYKGCSDAAFFILLMQQTSAENQISPACLPWDCSICLGL